MILAGGLPDLEDVRRLSSLLAAGTAIPGGRSVRAHEVVRNIVKEKLARNEIVASMTVRLARGVEIA